jgi:hypothetical protein
MSRDNHTWTANPKVFWSTPATTARVLRLAVDRHGGRNRSTHRTIGSHSISDSRLNGNAARRPRSGASIDARWNGAECVPVVAWALHAPPVSPESQAFDDFTWEGARYLVGQAIKECMDRGVPIHPRSRAGPPETPAEPQLGIGSARSSATSPTFGSAAARCRRAFNSHRAGRTEKHSPWRILAPHRRLRKRWKRLTAMQIS